MRSIDFARVQLLVAAVFKSYTCWYVSWAIALALGGGAIIWMFTEVLNSYDLTSEENNGNFGRIAERGQIHLALAIIPLVTQCAMGIFGATYVCS